MCRPAPSSCKGPGRDWKGRLTGRASALLPSLHMGGLTERLTTPSQVSAGHFPPKLLWMNSPRVPP